MLPLLEFDIAERRVIAAGALAPLAQALRSELSPLMQVALPIPDAKARLTRIGGRCKFDGILLDFDPWSPHAHKCRQCSRVFTEYAHHEWWAMGAQLWIAERAVQAAALQLLTNDEDAGALAVRILNELAERYGTWPNKDNALGPTRPFFSTYLESIWLLNLCHAVTLLEAAGVDAERSRVLSRVRDKLVMPSRELIASFNEGRSNRQVWNEVAILSASRTLGDHASVEHRLQPGGGLFKLLQNGLLDDGTWYEGENYHLFAHRGLWYGVQLLRALQRPLPPELDARYRAGFVTPFLGVLPDDTIPSRRDSQYAVSIRQWRFAEWCELGVAHATQHDGPGAAPDERLVGLLQRLYNSGEVAQRKGTQGESAEREGTRPGGVRGKGAQREAARLVRQLRHPYSTADAERNEPPGALTRADLSWRALLMAPETLPSGESWAPQSVCLPQQGLAVIRREEGRMYAALEGGHTGGGHGHPDQLALTLQYEDTRWLEDPGTGSYVERTLHWYRSTLAHAAPLVDGASQDAVSAQLLAFEDRGAAGWICKRVENIKPGVNMQRTLVVCDGYIIDLLEWDANREVQVDLPISRNIDMIGGGDWISADPGGAGGLEDGFDFLTDVVMTERAQSTTGFNISGSVEVVAFYNSRIPLNLWRAKGPGAPGHAKAPLYWFRMVAEKGYIVGLWGWRGFRCSMDVSFDEPGIRCELPDGTSAVHTRTGDGWHIALSAANATSSIDLAYLPHVAKGDGPNSTSASETPSPLDIPLAPSALAFQLGESHYLRTEQSWTEAGSLTSEVKLSAASQVLRIEVSVKTNRPPTVPPPNAENELDNERADVNADGVQLYIGNGPSHPWTSSWLAVPASESAPHARVTPLIPGSQDVTTTWSTVPGGWTMTLELPCNAIPAQDDGTFGLEIIINERPFDRERRRGQLVLSGGGGFGYLRGDRSNPVSALTFRLPQTLTRD